MKTKKHADVSQVANGEEGDARHMENLLLGEVEGSKGTKWLSEVVGCKRLGFQLDSSAALFSICFVYCLFFTVSICRTLGYRTT